MEDRGGGGLKTAAYRRRWRIEGGKEMKRFVAKDNDDDDEDANTNL